MEGRRNIFRYLINADDMGRMYSEDFDELKNLPSVIMTKKG
jgi:hypothetical protein